MLSKSSSALVLALALVSAGCQRQAGITTYTTPRESAPAKPTDFTAVSRQLDHMLAAILPVGEKAWFFKVTGPAPVIERRREDFLAFLKTVEKGSADAAPTWQLPESWQEQGASRMRAATLIVPDDDGPLEITVSDLPLTDDWDDFLLRNVNRWMGQLSQGPLASSTIEKLSEEVSTAAGTATVIELAGVLKSDDRDNPHAGMTRSKSARSSPSPPQQSEEEPLDFDTPDGWQPGRTSMMRKAAFNVVEDDQQAEATVIDLPAAGGAQIADVAANVRRWAGQVGLGALDEETLSKLLQETTIDGTKGSYVALLGPDGPERPVAMLAAMVVRDDKVWFFKLIGDRSLVEKQQDAFRSFLQSVRFR